jgi:uncharacterized membrane protein
MADQEQLRLRRAELQTTQECQSFESNRHSRVVGNRLRVLAATVGAMLLVVAALIVLRTGHTTAAADGKAVYAIGALGVALIGGALKSSPSDLKPSTMEFDAIDPGGGEPHSSGSKRA